MFFLLLGLFAADVRERGAELEAARRWAEAAAVYESALPDAGEDRASLQLAIAEMRFNQGDYPGARKWLREAEASLRYVGRSAPGWGQLLNAKAALYLVDGNLSAALRVLAGVAPFAGTLHSLASVEAQTGNLVRAEEHQRQALALFRQQHGDRHDSVQRAWVSLSTYQGLREDWRGAEQSLLQALAIAETDEVVHNYVVVLDRLHRKRDADVLRRRHVGTLIKSSDLVDVQRLRQGRGAMGVGVR